MPLSYDDLLGYANNAGFSGPSAYTAAAIGMAESSGNPGAINYSDPGNSYGVMQINGSAWGEDFAQGALDPQTAMNDAYYISSGGTDFTPWSTYNSGAYSSYLPTSASNDNSGYTADVFGNLIPNSPGGQFVDSSGATWGSNGQGGEQLTSSPVGQAANAAKNAAGSMIPQSISNFFSFLTSQGGVERIGVVIIGIMLLGVAGFMLATKGFEGTVRTVARNV